MATPAPTTHKNLWYETYKSYNDTASLETSSSWLLLYFVVLPWLMGLGDGMTSTATSMVAKSSTQPPILIQPRHSHETITSTEYWCLKKLILIWPNGLIFYQVHFLYKHDMHGVSGYGIFWSRKSNFCTTIERKTGIQASEEEIGHSGSYNYNNDKLSTVISNMEIVIVICLVIP